MPQYIDNIPSISVTYASSGISNNVNQFGMRPMQERAFEKRGEQYLLIKSPPASGKSRPLMFIALDKIRNQGIIQAIIVVPERSFSKSHFLNLKDWCSKHMAKYKIPKIFEIKTSLPKNKMGKVLWRNLK